MANIKFNRKEFEKHIKLTPEIEEKITLMGTHFETADSENIEVEIGPNRPDLYSLQGFLRSLETFLGKKSNIYKIEKSGYQLLVDKSVEKVRPFCMAAIIKGVKFTEEKIIEIMNWQERIHATLGRHRKKIALGYYVLDKIKFPVTYTTKKPEEIVFEPLDMPQKMNALQILSRHPCGRDYGNQLEGKDKFPVYYDSNNEVLSMPPIINSNNSGKIIPGTTDVLIECSGTNQELLNKVITMALVDLIDCGGKAYSIDIVYDNKKETITLEHEKIKINIEDCNKLLGLNLNESEFKKLIEKMGYNYTNREVQIPAYRVDILHPHDIYEDIAIAYGYNNFIPEIPQISTTGEISRKEEIKKKISDILVGLDIQELSTLHLLTKEEAGNNKIIEVADSKSDYKFLRPNLLVSILKTLKENTDSEYPQRVFELGVSFHKDDSQETGIREKEQLVISLIPGNFTELKQILEYLARMLGIEFKIEETTKQGFIEGRTGKIIFNNEDIGFIGEAHPSLLQTHKLKMPLACLEIDIDKIIEKLS